MNTIKMNQSHAQYLAVTLYQLCQAPKYLIGEFSRNPLWLLHGYQGIYLITDTEGQVIYVGKTDGRDGVAPKEMGVADRMYGHASTDSTVRTRLNVSIEVFKSYFVRVLRIDQAELRGAVELYAIAIFRPPGNRFYKK
jgi:hypothetical protein